MTNNPLIEKYNELYPPKNPYSHLRYEDVCLIRTLERMVEDLKTGKASHISYETKDNYKRAHPIPIWEIMEPSTKIDYNSFVKYDEGQMITIQVFRHYD